MISRLDWVEPPKYRQDLYDLSDRGDPRSSLKVAGFCFVGIMAIRYLAEIRPERGNHPPAWPMVVAVGMLVSLYIAFLLPRHVGLLSKSFVILSDKGVNRNSIGFGGAVRFIPWSSVSSAAFETVVVKRNTYETLVLFGPNGDALMELALGTKPTAKEIRDFLQFKGIQV